MQRRDLTPLTPRRPSPPMVELRKVVHANYEAPKPCPVCEPPETGSVSQTSMNWNGAALEITNGKTWY